MPVEVKHISLLPKVCYMGMWNFGQDKNLTPAILRKAGVLHEYRLRVIRCCTMVGYSLVLPICSFDIPLKTVSPNDEAQYELQKVTYILNASLM